MRMPNKVKGISPGTIKSKYRKEHISRRRDPVAYWISPFRSRSIFQLLDFTSLTVFLRFFFSENILVSYVKVDFPTRWKTNKPPKKQSPSDDSVSWRVPEVVFEEKTI
jgi:hypothetical protein